jgi:ABC-type phosphate transport system substrate-binding protein
MKAFIIAILTLVVTAGSISTTHAEGTEDKLVAVVHAENKIAKIGKATLKAMYLGQSSFWDNDVRVKPYNRAHAGPAGKLFFKNVLGMAPSRYRHHWQKLQLSGQGVEPDIVGTAATLAAKVASSPGAVGYILASEASALDSRVRVIPIE